ncbi:hypothetical protein B0H19DRAFT_1244334 [Mycena capillaripes]|nr:hypothetical protein B0H19DRAFT_1244334 [Mycena capillaripes]
MSTSSGTITTATMHATLPLDFSRARYHDLDINAPRLVSKIQDVQRHLDPEANRQKLLKLQEDLARQGPYSTQRLADTISKLQRRIDSPSAHSQLERILAELEDQQAREKAEVASYYGKLRPSRAQTLIPDVLSEIFRQCGVRSRSPQSYSGGPLNLEMRTSLNILRVCSSWRAVALGTPDLWSELTYSDAGTLPLPFYDQWLSRAAAVTLNLTIWPHSGRGEDNYWSGATALLHKHCNAIERLALRLPVETSRTSLQPLFPHPHRPISLRKLTVYSYDAFIHSTLSNIPWNQLSSIEFRFRYEARFTPPSQLGSILSQTHNLTHLLVDMGPSEGFGPSSAQVLPLQKLRALEISWSDSERHYQLGIIPYSFVDLFDKLRVPALKSLRLAVDEHVNPYVLPALTGLAGRSGFSLDSLHIELASPIRAAVLPEITIAFLREQVSLKSLHWHSENYDLLEFVEALTHIGIGKEALLPNLEDISLGINSYEGLLPPFTDMVASRQAAESLPQTIVPLRSFDLKAYMQYYYEPDDGADSDGDCPEPWPSDDESKDANEKASRRLLDFAKKGLGGSFDFRHWDQALKFTEPKWCKTTTFGQTSGENLILDCDEDMVWHWIDAQTVYRQEGL